MDLARLRALHAVHQHGSVGAAAAALGYSPSAVSQQIAKLEREVGAALLARRGRGVTLTGDALVLVAAAGEITGVVERARAELEHRRGRPVGELRVAAFPTAARGLLPGALAALVALHPEVAPMTVEAEPHRGLELVSRGEADLALVHDWEEVPLPSPSGIERHPLGPDVCDLLLPADHPLACLPTVGRERLADSNWICQPPGTICHDWVMRCVIGFGNERRVAHHAAEYATQVSLVAAGLGVALVPRLGRGELPPEVVAVALEPRPVRRVSVLWRTDAARRPAVVALVRHLRRAIGEEAAGTPAPAARIGAAPAVESAPVASTGEGAGPPRARSPREMRLQAGGSGA